MPNGTHGGVGGGMKKSSLPDAYFLLRFRRICAIMRLIRNLAAECEKLLFIGLFAVCLPRALKGGAGGEAPA